MLYNLVARCAWYTSPACLAFLVCFRFALRLWRFCRVPRFSFTCPFPCPSPNFLVDNPSRSVLPFAIDRLWFLGYFLLVFQRFLRFCACSAFLRSCLALHSILQCHHTSFLGSLLDGSIKRHCFRVFFKVRMSKNANFGLGMHSLQKSIAKRLYFTC